MKLLTFVNLRVEEIVFSEISIRGVLGTGGRDFARERRTLFVGVVLFARYGGHCVEALERGEAGSGRVCS